MGLAYRDEDTPEAKKQIAAWRREGHGIWIVFFVVLGFDEDFIMRLPGRLSESFAKTLARGELAKALGVRTKDVIFKNIHKES